MRLGLQMEQYLVRAKVTTVSDLARQFGISLKRCRQELDSLAPFGIEVHGSRVLAVQEDAAEMPASR